jgi:hypothetical protein
MSGSQQRSGKKAKYLIVGMVYEDNELENGNSRWLLLVKWTNFLVICH